MSALFNKNDFHLKSEIVSLLLTNRGVCCLAIKTTMSGCQNLQSCCLLKKSIQENFLHEIVSCCDVSSFSSLSKSFNSIYAAQHLIDGLTCCESVKSQHAADRNNIFPFMVNHLLKSMHTKAKTNRFSCAGGLLANQTTPFINNCRFCFLLYYSLICLANEKSRFIAVAHN